jgi:hypothetical protein
LWRGEARRGKVWSDSVVYGSARQGFFRYERRRPEKINKCGWVVLVGLGKLRTGDVWHGLHGIGLDGQGNINEKNKLKGE